MLRRYSSHRQKDVSIEQQVAACQAHAADLGIALVESYEDRAISGKTDNRPAFRRMMRDAEAGLFAYVIAWKSNRIGRNMMEAMVNEARLSELGVKVLCVEEDFDDSAAGRFALRSMMNVNQFYIENMAEDIRRGMRDNAKNCKVNGPSPMVIERAPTEALRKLLETEFSATIKKLDRPERNTSPMVLPCPFSHFGWAAYTPRCQPWRRQRMK